MRPSATPCAVNGKCKVVLPRRARVLLDLCRGQLSGLEPPEQIVKDGASPSYKFASPFASLQGQSPLESRSSVQNRTLLENTVLTTPQDDGVMPLA